MTIRSVPIGPIVPRRSDGPQDGVTVRANDTRRAAESSEVAADAVRAAGGSPSTDRTAMMRSRPSRPPSSHPIRRSDGGSRPSAATRSFVAIESIAPELAATTRTTVTAGDVPVSMAQIPSAAQMAASPRRSRTPSRSAPRGPARSCSRATSPSTPSRIEQSWTRIPPATPSPEARNAAASSPTTNATADSRSGSGPNRTRSQETGTESRRFRSRATGPSLGRGRPDRSRRAAWARSSGVSTSCHQASERIGTAVTGAVAARSVTAPASEPSPRARVRRTDSNTSRGRRSAPASTDGETVSFPSSSTRPARSTLTLVASFHTSGSGAGSTRTAGRPAPATSARASSAKTLSAVTTRKVGSSPSEPSAAASDTAFPSSHPAASTTCTRPGAVRWATAATGPAWYPTTTTTRSTPVARSVRMARSTSRRPPSRTSAFEPPPVTARSRSDRPAARTTPTRGSPIIGGMLPGSRADPNGPRADHQADPLQGPEILEGIAGHPDHVGLGALVERRQRHGSEDPRGVQPGLGEMPDLPDVDPRRDRTVAEVGPVPDPAAGRGEPPEVVGSDAQGCGVGGVDVERADHRGGAGQRSHQLVAEPLRPWAVSQLVDAGADHPIGLSAPLDVRGHGQTPLVGGPAHRDELGGSDRGPVEVGGLGDVGQREDVLGRPGQIPDRGDAAAQHRSGVGQPDVDVVVDHARQKEPVTAELLFGGRRLPRWPGEVNAAALKHHGR